MGAPDGSNVTQSWAHVHVIGANGESYGVQAGHNAMQRQRHIPANHADVHPAAISALCRSGRLHERTLPPRARNGAAVLVVPGGGYSTVMIGYEGTDVADWLCARGFCAYALQYTLKPRNRLMYNRAQGVEPAVEEGVAALSIVQQRAVEFGLDPTRSCVLGFSAGAHLATCICRRLAEVPHVLRPRAVVLAHPPARNPLCACILGHIWNTRVLSRVAGHGPQHK